MGDGPQYDPKHDGSLEEYLKLHDGHTSMPLFKGAAQYRMLWDQGYLLPDWTTIRLMYNSHRFDEHYLVVDRDLVEGIGGGVPHSGKEGIHSIDKLLEGDAPCFEAFHLAPQPMKRI